MKRARADENDGSNMVGLNVGGRIFYSTTSTLTSAGGFFERLLTGTIPSKRDKDGNVWIDRDPDVFPYILNFLRSGVVPEIEDDTYLLRRICAEADFYQIPDLSEALYCGALDASYDELPTYTVEKVHEDRKILKDSLYFLRGFEIATGRLRKYLIKSSYDDTPILGEIQIFNLNNRKWDTISLKGQSSFDDVAKRLGLVVVPDFQSSEELEKIMNSRGIKAFPWYVQGIFTDLYIRKIKNVRQLTNKSLNLHHFKDRDAEVQQTVQEMQKVFGQ